jgi:hypothetical protein
MAAENPTWGEERIADEILLKLGIRLSPRTVGKYVKQRPCPHGSKDQRWSIFLHNHAHGIVACDFFVSVTARFRILYVFVALEIGSRRLVHFNVTEHPSAEWTLQQLREALPGDRDYKFLLHDRHKTFSTNLDEEVESWGIHVLKSPVRMPTANAHCEPLIGTMLSVACITSIGGTPPHELCKEFLAYHRVEGHHSNTLRSGDESKRYFRSCRTA